MALGQPEQGRSLLLILSKLLSGSKVHLPHSQTQATSPEGTRGAQLTPTLPWGADRDLAQPTPEFSHPTVPPVNSTFSPCVQTGIRQCSCLNKTLIKRFPLSSCF